MANDGRFDKVNAQRQAKAARDKLQRSLLAQLADAVDVEDCKAVLARLIKATVR